MTLNSPYSSETEGTISFQKKAGPAQWSFCTSYILGVNIPGLVWSPIHNYSMDHTLLTHEHGKKESHQDTILNHQSI